MTMRKKKETITYPMDELTKCLMTLGLNSHYELTCHRQSKKLSVNIFRHKTYLKFLGKIPEKLGGFDVSYIYARNFRGTTYER